MKQKLLEYIDQLRPEAEKMADEIFDRPELAKEEYFASKLLEDYLEKNGFQVTRGLGRLETAFRAEYQSGSGNGIRIGLLCEYDALEKLGHGCGHHMQGPCICAAAVALKAVLGGTCDFHLIVYGTPAEEGGGGKITMLQDGYLKDIDVALMMHGSPMTCVDVRSMANASFKAVFSGKSAHAALKPEDGRSAFDALILSFNGLEFLREHIREDSRIHYTVAELPGPSNVVPSRAVGSISVRSYNSVYLHEELIPRVKDVMRGAAIMTGTTCEITQGSSLEAKIPVLKLNDLVMDNARLVNAPNIQEPRKKTGSSDFGNVMYELPGCCIRIAFVPDGTSSHTQTFVDYGKSAEAHDAIAHAAKILAGTSYDLISQPEVMREIREEFERNKGRKD